MAEVFSSTGKARIDRRLWIAFGALIAVSILVRIVLVLNFRARASYDTQSYIDAAKAIATMDFSDYDGRRTPVYPVLLILCGMDFDNVRLVQALLGIAIAAMLFSIAWYRSRNALTAFIVGLLSSLALMELFYEQIIYSETFCTFWIVLSVLAYARIELGRSTSAWDYALMGLAAALAGMTRPMFLYLGPLYAALMIVRGRRVELRKLRDVRLMLVLAPTLLLALGWSAFNLHTIGYFGVTITTGFNLSNHSGGFMELAPPRYSKIADIYLRYRGWQIQQMGSHTMTIWLAEAEIERRLGFSPAQLSKQLTRMSLEMFVQHPLLYLESVARAWARFWGIGFYEFVGAYKEAAGGPFAYGLLLAMGTWQLAINAAFLAIAGFSLTRWLRRRASFDFDLGVIAIVLAGSVVQALMEYGENVRYLAPLAPLTIYVVVTFAWWAVKSAGSKSGIQS
jgi:hypothetical protein